MKAIVTKYLGPTNSRSGRIKASAEGVKSIYVSYGTERNRDEEHIAAACELANTFDWLRAPWMLASGTMPNGEYCHVFVEGRTAVDALTKRKPIQEAKYLVHRPKQTGPPGVVSRWEYLSRNNDVRESYEWVEGIGDAKAYSFEEARELACKLGCEFFDLARIV